MSVTLFSPYQEAQKFKQVKGSRRETRHHHHHPCTQLPKSLFPCIRNLLLVPPSSSLNNHDNGRRSTSGVVSFPPPKSSAGVCCSLMENPVIWVSRVCVYYALLKAGLVGSQPTLTLPFISTSASDSGGGIPDLGFSKWLHHLQAGSSEEKEATNRRKLVRNWHPTTKGTLKRSYRVPSKPEGRRLLKAIASLLSDDDEFRDATSHKGCQIRRETAHGESVCCNNVRALFDELPTPHLVLEITPFPAGPLSEKDYVKAGKLEKVLRSGTSI